MRKRIKQLLYMATCLLLILSIIVPSAPAQAAPASQIGLKWTTQAAAGNGTWASVTWSPELGKFVAVARGSSFPVATHRRVMTSVDGQNWTLVGSANISVTAATFTSVTWSPDLDLFVAVACNRGTFGVCSTATTNFMRVMTSLDGEVWTERTTVDQRSTWQSVVWSSELELFVAVADNGDNSIMTSPDGINWTARTAPEDNAWKSVTWSPDLNLFVAVATSGINRVMTSPDGINWTSRSASQANTWQSVVWSPELDKFVAVSSDGTDQVMTSANGINWTGQAAASANPWRSVTWSSGLLRFVAVADGGTNRIMTSADGETWTGQAASVDNVWSAITWSPELQAFVSVGSGGTFDSGSVTSPRAMTGSIITASTNEVTNIAAREATLNGNYADDFSASNLFFTGTSAFFRYRPAGSSDPYTATTPQPVTSAGAFTANITGLAPDNTTYEYKAVVQWPGANGTQTLEGGLQTFTTLYADDDNDDIYNVIENAAPNGGDANNDGTLDSTQPFVASFVSAVTGKYAVLELNSVCQIDTAVVKAASSNATTDPHFTYPIGLMSFTADCGTPGFIATVTHYYFGASGEYSLRKYNPHTNAYFALDDGAQQTVNIGGQSALKATFAVTDGSSRDMDNTADGIIIDPAGLAASVNTGSLANTGQNPLLAVLVAISLLVSGISFAQWQYRLQSDH